MEGDPPGDAASPSREEAATAPLAVSRSPVEAILHEVFYKFQKEAAENLEHYAYFCTVDSVLEIFSENAPSPTFEQTILTLAELSKHAVNRVVAALFDWRREQTTVIPEEVKEKTEAERAYKKFNLQEALQQLVQRKETAVEYIFSKALYLCLAAYLGTALDDELVFQVEKIAFSVVCNADKILSTVHMTMIENRRMIIVLYGEILGVLTGSRVGRFAAITDRFVSHIRSRIDSSAGKQELVPVIRSMQYLQLSISTAVDVDQGVNFLGNILVFMGKIKKPEGKHSFCDVLVALLSPLASIDKENKVDYGDFYRVMKQLYSKVKKWSKKAKHQAYTYPVLAAILTAGDVEMFHSEFSDAVRSFLKSLKDRTSLLCAVSLDCLLHILGYYLNLPHIAGLGDTSRDEANSLLKEILDSLLPASNRRPSAVPSVLYPAHAQNIIMDICLLMADHRPHFIKKYVFDVLLSVDSKQQLLTDQTLIVLKMFTVLADREENELLAAKTALRRARLGSSVTLAASSTSPGEAPLEDNLEYSTERVRQDLRDRFFKRRGTIRRVKESYQMRKLIDVFGSYNAGLDIQGGHVRPDSVDQYLSTMQSVRSDVSSLRFSSPFSSLGRRSVQVGAPTSNSNAAHISGMPSLLAHSHDRLTVQAAPVVSTALSAILTTLDEMLGQNVNVIKVDSSHVSASGTSWRQFEGYPPVVKSLCINIFRIALGLVPKVFPNSLSSKNVVELATRMCYHSERELRTEAQSVVLELFDLHEHIRPLLIERLLLSWVIKIDEFRCASEVADSSTRLFQMLDTWVQMSIAGDVDTVLRRSCRVLLDATDCPASTSDGNVVPPSQLDYNKVQAGLLLLICSGSAAVRSRALQLLELLQQLYEATNDSISNTVLIQDIVDQLGAEFVQRAYNRDKRFHHMLSSTAPATDAGTVSSDHDVKVLALKDGRMDQVRWSRIVGWIARYLCKHASGSCAHVVSMVIQRLVTYENHLLDVLHEESSDESRLAMLFETTSFNALLAIYRNSWIAALVCMNGPVRASDMDDSMKKVGFLDGHRSIVRSALVSSSTEGILARDPELYTKLLGHMVRFLRQNVYPCLTRVATTALSRSNVTILPLLYVMLRSHGELADVDADRTKGKRRRDQLRTDLSLLYAQISDDNRNLSVHGSTSSTLHLVHFASSQIAYVTSAANLGLQELSELRINICTIIRNLAASTAAHLSVEQRRTWFKSIFRWSAPHTKAGKAYAKSLELERSAILSRCREHESQRTLEQAWKKQDARLKIAATEALAELLNGPLIVPTLSSSNDQGEATGGLLLSDILDWVRKLSRSSELALQEAGTLAVVYLMDGACAGNDSKDTGGDDSAQADGEAQEVWATLIDECYTDDHHCTRTFFLAVADFFQPSRLQLIKDLEADERNEWIVRLLVLVLYELGDKAKHVRHGALALLDSICGHFFDHGTDQSNYPFSVTATLADAYENVQYFICCKLASDHAYLGSYMFQELTRRLGTKQERRRRGLLRLIAPWVPHLPWQSATEFGLDPHSILNTLFRITKAFKDEFFAPMVMDLWRQVVSEPHETNVGSVVEYLLEKCSGVSSSQEELNVSKRIALFISRCQPKLSVDALMGALTLASIENNEQEAIRVRNQAGQIDGSDKDKRATQTERVPKASRRERGDAGVLQSPAPRDRLIGRDDDKAVRLSPFVTRNPQSTPTKRVRSTVKLTAPDTPNDDGSDVNASFSDPKKRTEARRDLVRSILFSPDGDDDGGLEGAVPLHSAGRLDSERIRSRRDLRLPLSVYGVVMARDAETGAQRRLSLRRSDIAIVLLVEIAYECDDELREHLPVLLHRIVLRADDPLSYVVEHTTILFVYLIHSLIVRQIQHHSGIGDTELRLQDAQELIAYIMEHHQGQLWNNEDLEIDAIDKPLASTSVLCMLVERVCGVFRISEPELRERWGYEALQTATRSSDWHAVARSHQCYRQLRPVLTGDHVIELLDTLVRFLSDPHKHHLGLSVECLHTLLSLVQSSSSSDLQVFPQLVWGCMALLWTDIIQVFYLGLRILDEMVVRMDLYHNTEAMDALICTLPSDWEPPFVGVQELVLRGLTAPLTTPLAIMMLSDLLECDTAEFLDCAGCPRGRSVMGVFGLLPFLCYALMNSDGHTSAAHAPPVGEDTTAVPDGFGDRLSNKRIASRLVALCEKNGWTKLARVWSRYENQYYSNPVSFLQDLRRPLCESFFLSEKQEIVADEDSLPRWALVLEFFDQMLKQGSVEFHIPVLQILYSVFLDTEFYEKTIFAVTEHVAHLSGRVDDESEQLDPDVLQTHAIIVSVLNTLVTLLNGFAWKFARQVLDVIVHNGVHLHNRHMNHAAADTYPYVVTTVQKAVAGSPASHSLHPTALVVNGTSTATSSFHRKPADGTIRTIHALDRVVMHSQRNDSNVTAEDVPSTESSPSKMKSSRRRLGNVRVSRDSRYGLRSVRLSTAFEAFYSADGAMGTPKSREDVTSADDDGDFGTPDDATGEEYNHISAHLHRRRNSDVEDDGSQSAPMESAGGADSSDDDDDIPSSTYKRLMDEYGKKRHADDDTAHNEPETITSTAGAESEASNSGSDDEDSERIDAPAAGASGIFDLRRAFHGRNRPDNAYDSQSDPFEGISDIDDDSSSEKADQEALADEIPIVEDVSESDSEGLNPAWNQRASDGGGGVSGHVVDSDSTTSSDDSDSEAGVDEGYEQDGETESAKPRPSEAETEEDSDYFFAEGLNANPKP